MQDPIDQRQESRIKLCLSIALAAVVLVTVPGCFWCCDYLTGYEVVGELRDESGNPLSGVRVKLSLINAEAGVFMEHHLAAETDGVLTDEAGVFQGEISMPAGYCGVTILLIVVPFGAQFEDAPLPDPAFVTLDFVDTGLQVPVEVTPDMVTRVPDNPIDRLDLGVVVVPGQ